MVRHEDGTYPSFFFVKYNKNIYIYLLKRIDIAGLFFVWLDQFCYIIRICKFISHVRMWPIRAVIRSSNCITWERSQLRLTLIGQKWFSHPFKSTHKLPKIGPKMGKTWLNSSTQNKNLS